MMVIPTIIGGAVALKLTDVFIKEDKKKGSCKRKYKITYKNPMDKNRKTWKFCSREGAEKRQRDLARFWKVPKSRIKIQKVI